MQLLLLQSPNRGQGTCAKAVCALGLSTLPLPLSRPSAEASLPVGMPSAESSLWTGRFALSTPLDLQGLLQRLLDPQDRAPGSLGPRCEVSAPHKQE